jgi:hypothetical protein
VTDKVALFSQVVLSDIAMFEAVCIATANYTYLSVSAKTLQGRFLVG